MTPLPFVDCMQQVLGQRFGPLSVVHFRHRASSPWRLFSFGIVITIKHHGPTPATTRGSRPDGRGLI
jgi:hypothetical protein